MLSHLGITTTQATEDARANKNMEKVIIERLKNSLKNDSFSDEVFDKVDG